MAASREPYREFEPPCSFIFAKCFAPQHALLVFTIDPVEAWIDRYSLEGLYVDSCHWSRNVMFGVDSDVPAATTAIRQQVHLRHTMDLTLSRLC